jgi:Beta propeller domain
MENAQPVASDNGASGSSGGAAGASSNQNSFSGGSNYGTNNQESQLEEGDTTVSDGLYVYSAYSDYLLVWDATNGSRVVAQIKMPDVTNSNTTTASGSTSSSSAGTASTGDESFMPASPYAYQPRPEIKTLLLYEGRLLVIVQGYGVGLLPQYGLNESVLYDFLNTHVRVYETSDLVGGGSGSGNNYDPVFVADLQGSYQAVRSLNGKVHIMSTSAVNTYTDLVMPFEIANAPDTLGTLSPTQYQEAAVEKAQKEAIPRFVNKMMDQLALGDGGFPRLVKISLFQNEYSGSTNSYVEAMTYPSGILNSLALVHSFDMTSARGGSGTTTTTTTTAGGGETTRRRRNQEAGAVASAGAFLPSYWAQFYGSETHLIIAGQGSRIDAASAYSVETTNFLSFRINDDDNNNGTSPTVVPEAAGSVDGYVINNYAMDVKDSFLRVGVSINNRWFYMTDPMPMMEDTGGMASDPATTTTTTTTTTSATPDTNSTTENYMVILSLPGRANATDAGTMQEVGRLQLGKPNELFTAIRIYDNVAYAVTYEQTDPLYVLDLSVQPSRRGRAQCARVLELPALAQRQQHAHAGRRVVGRRERDRYRDQAERVRRHQPIGPRAVGRARDLEQRHLQQLHGGRVRLQVAARRPSRSGRHHPAAARGDPRRNERLAERVPLQRVPHLFGQPHDDHQAVRERIRVQRDPNVRPAGGRLDRGQHRPQRRNCIGWEQLREQQRQHGGRHGPDDAVLLLRVHGPARHAVRERPHDDQQPLRAEPEREHVRANVGARHSHPGVVHVVRVLRRVLVVGELFRIEPHHHPPARDSCAGRFIWRLEEATNMKVNHRLHHQPKHTE